MSSNVLPAVDEVVSVIRTLGQQNAALELTKSFRGIVVQQDIRALEVDPDAVAFRVSSVEMCAALEGEVYLHSRYFPKPVMAQIKSLDLLHGRLVLSGFAYSENEWKKRQHERVQPKHPTYVTLHCRKKTARACLENVSANGMRVFIYKILECGVRIQPGMIIQLNFELTPERKFAALKGEIIYINKTGNFSSTIGVRLLPKAQEARLLEEYVALRKREILEELSRAYWELSRPRGVESLYF
jgi:hypothetical protein